MMIWIDAQEVLMSTLPKALELLDAGERLVEINAV